LQLRRKRRDITWRPVLFLLIYGVLVGRLSFVNLDIWGSGNDTRHQPLFRLGFFVGTLTFLAGILGFVEILVKGASTSSNSSIAASLSASTKEPSIKQTAVASREGAMLMSLRVALISAIAVACFGVFRDVERKSMWGGSYFRSYFLSALLFLIMSQLAYVVALFRIWTGPDRTGLAISFASGIVEAAVHLPFFSSSMSSDPWSLLPSVLGVSCAILAYVVWRSARQREGDVRYAASVFGGFLAYTLLWRVVDASLLLPY
jgi:hypothetical protein